MTTVQFEFIRTINGGGQGRVDLVKDHQRQQYVALKVMFATDIINERRFVREVEEIQNLDHPGIIKIFQFGRLADQSLFYTMPFYQDGTLADKIQGLSQQGLCFSPEAAISLVSRVAETLQFSHAWGIYHRDLKPANIMLPQNGCPILADWGLAKFSNRQSAALTQGGLGTLGYSAPEQLATGKGDARSDVYSLGIVLLEMLTGNPAREAVASVADVRLRDLIHQMIAWDPEVRLQSMDGVLHGLAQASAPQPPQVSLPQASSSGDDKFWTFLGSALLVGGALWAGSQLLKK